MFELPGYHIGDTWYFVRKGRAHMFYLYSPEHVPLHTRWDIGHAVSDDLRHWRDEGVILRPGPAGAWDGICPATGSVAAFDGRFYMAYTGNFSGPEPTTGLAVSDDLYTWEKCAGNPATAADGQCYTRAPNLAWNQPRWRDPFLFFHAGWVYQLVTAALPDRGPAVCGTVGVARTRDLVHWELRPPLDVPALAQDLECPKLYVVDGRYYLLVSISEAIIGPDLRAAQPPGLPVSTTYCLVSESFAGPYRLHGAGRILGDGVWGAPYACEAVFFRGRFWLLGTCWEERETDRVCAPIPLRVTPEGFRAETQ